MTPSRNLHLDAQNVLCGFLGNVYRDPQAVAIVDGLKRICYGDLARAAEQVRRDITAVGIGPGEYVGISMRRSWHAIAAILGTMAAGARYVPLDPLYPETRLNLMADDSKLSVVCVDQGSGSRLDSRIERVAVSGSLADTELNADAAGSSGYLIYTSGSTGRPKGVVVPQQNVLDLFAGIRGWGFAFTAEDVWTLHHSYSFDVSVWEMWGALLSGGSLVIVGEEARRDPHLLLNLLLDSKVSVLSLVPTSFKHLALAYEQEQPALESLRYIVLGGESVDKPSVRRWLALRMGPEQLINMYGPTETTVYVTAAAITSADVADDSTPTLIGDPLPHLDVALVRGDGTVVPDDGPGEIWVSGSTLSPGYLGSPELTAERFVTRKLGTDTRRWYRTGDLARRNPAGQLLYLGRIDSQVSLRGFRIELGEVEATLRDNREVLDAAAAVVALPGNEKALIAAVVTAASASAVTGRTLRAMCLRRLPSHMVPDRVVIVSRIPTTPSGKVDRRAISAIALQ